MTDLPVTVLFLPIAWTPLPSSWKSSFVEEKFRLSSPDSSDPSGFRLRTDVLIKLTTDEEGETTILYKQKPSSAHLPVSSTCSLSPLEGVRQAAVLQGQGFVHSPVLASPTVVQRTHTGLPTPSPPRLSLPRRQSCLTSSAVTASSHVDFLRKGLGRQFSKEVVGTMLRVLRTSSMRLYDSCWRRFTDFLTSISKGLTGSTVLDFSAG